MHIYERLGVRPLINARSFSTKAGGCALPREVLEAMSQAAECCVRMDELQSAASDVISRSTGAEAGIVTSGAAAALTLGAAACLAGLDVNRMNRLPDTNGMPDEFIVHRAHRNDYDHAVRASGARFTEVGFGYYTFAYEVASAITNRTAALYYQAGVNHGVLPLDEYVEIAHRHSLPVLVDAAAEMPPAFNLNTFIRAGADLVAFSGGKHIQGPQATGILCGRRDLIMSAALQHQDMDVFPQTWPLRALIEDGTLAGPPHHGIGRGFKVGKEEIAGLVAALELYQKRDFAAERARWTADLECIAAGIKGMPGLSARVVYPQPSGKEVPGLNVRVDAAAAGMDAHAVINALQSGEPPICVFEKIADAGEIVFFPEALRAGEAAVVARRLRTVLERSEPATIATKTPAATRPG
ncbi:MAG TPA: aminotransferase class V-fold PLP-dependent enzyme [Bryobacteraceae bacterium]|nr:aminotransferase class V-fold PLP-dependent enzyme [Bryobacteraceae bacterium]HXJ42204.1 aminotransferase class V-fold PLP-dependent enzyme [Bryobacteraceae bacterium]